MNKMEVKNQTGILEVNKDLAYLLGAFKDGSIYKNEKEGIYRIRIYQRCKEWLEMTEEIFLKVFKKKLYLRKDPRKILWYLETNDKTLFILLRDLLAKPVPDIIKNNSIEIKLAFIQGVFDAEGGILRIEQYENESERLKKKLQDIRVRFGQANRELLEFIKTTLEEIKIDCGKVCGPYYKNEKSQGYFEVNSYGIENLRKFLSLIGTRHPVKLMRMEKIDAVSNKRV